MKFTKLTVTDRVKSFGLIFSYNLLFFSLLSLVSFGVLVPLFQFLKAGTVAFPSLSILGTITEIVFSCSLVVAIVTNIWTEWRVRKDGL